jgi:hypothetical protein
LSSPILDVSPTIKKEPEFGFSTDQRRQPLWGCHVKPAMSTTLPEHVIEMEGLSNPSQMMFP